MAEIYFEGNAPYSLKQPGGSVLGNVGSVGSVRGIAEGGGVAGPVGREKPGLSFKQTLGEYVNKVDQLQKTSDDFAKRLAAGEELDLHRVMIAGEQAGLAMQMTIQLRNRLVEAYQEILRMQV